MNEWRYAIGFQSLGQPHECKLYTSKTENIHYYVQFCCRFSWFAALFDNILPLSVGVSQKIGTKMEKIRLWNHVRGRTMWMLAWADETRKINNIKIPFSISRFYIRVEVMWDRGSVGWLRLATLGRRICPDKRISRILFYAYHRMRLT